LSIPVPTYNSRIIKVYLQFIARNYPQVNIDDVLEYAGITRYEAEDPAHWFNQSQVDRFHEYLVKKTGNSEISRHAGRYAASSEGMGAARQFTLGLISLSSVYLLMQKLYPVMSRGATVKAKKIGERKVEIVSTPNPGVEEKPYQCENRLGTFEGIAKLFHENFARIEHTACFHKGDDFCHYIISWEKARSHFWKKARNFSALTSAFTSILLYFILPFAYWLFFLVLYRLRFPPKVLTWPLILLRHCPSGKQLTLARLCSLLAPLSSRQM